MNENHFGFLASFRLDRFKLMNMILEICAIYNRYPQSNHHGLFWPDITRKKLIRIYKTHRIVDQSTNPPILSGQEPQIIALFGNRPLRGAKIFIFFLFSSTSATYTKPRTLASRMFSWVSFGSACTIAIIEFCICGDGSTLSKIIGANDSSASPPGRSEVSNAEALINSLEVRHLDKTWVETAYSRRFYK